MPRRYPCPECDDSVVSWMRVGESATCSACGAESEVPADAEEVAPERFPTPQRTASRLDRTYPAHRWALVCGLAAIALSVITFFITAVSTLSLDDAPETFFIVTPIVFLAGALIVGAALVARGLESIRAELAKGDRG